MFILMNFFTIALLYATVGFGGGSSYLAILAVNGVSYEFIPKIALLCNILVVTGGIWHYLKNGHFRYKLILPFVLSSVPMAFLGGSFPVSEKVFFILLTISLIFCGIRILFLSDMNKEEIRLPPLPISIFSGGILGFLSGMVGIGGGIFLSPLLINMGWARSKEAAAVASMFILLNSMAGLAGQFSKSTEFADPYVYFPLFFAVVLGGQIGSRIGTNYKVSYSLIQKLTGILTLVIGFQLLIKTIL